MRTIRKLVENGMRHWKRDLGKLQVVDAPLQLDNLDVITNVTA